MKMLDSVHAGIDSCYVRPMPTLYHNVVLFDVGDTVRVRARVSERAAGVQILQAVVFGTCSCNAWCIYRQVRQRM